MANHDDDPSMGQYEEEYLLADEAQFKGMAACLSEPRTKMKNIPPYNFTKAQLRALAWLPDDGVWKTTPGTVAAALHSLALHHPSLVECKMGDRGPLRWKLTAEGMAVRARLSGDIGMYWTPKI